MNDLSNPYQGTGEWLADRAGCCTASRMNDVLDVLKDGRPGAKRLSYAKELVAERLTSNSMTHVVTNAMRDGIEREPSARAEYEFATGNIVRLTGFVPHPRIEFAGASPDGLVEHDGLIEIKCPTEATYVEWLAAGCVPDKCKPQMIFQAACTGRGWIDFVAYHPDMPPKLRLFVRRFEPSAEEIAGLEAKVVEFLQQVDAIFEAITQREAA